MTIQFEIEELEERMASGATNGQLSYEGQPGNQGNGLRGYEGHPGNQGGHWLKVSSIMQIVESDLKLKKWKERTAFGKCSWIVGLRSSSGETTEGTERL